MKRVEYINGILQKEKFILQKEYGGFGIYARMTPCGLYANQDWLLVDGKTGTELRVASFNDICEEELLDMVDHFNQYGKFGVPGFYRGENLYEMHINGNRKI